MRSRAAKLATAVLALGVLIACPFTPALAGQGSEPSTKLEIKSHQIHPNQVVVQVKNAGNRHQMGWVRVEALVGGRRLQGLVVVSVSPNQTAPATVGFPGPVNHVIVMGVQEGPSPF